MSSARVDRIELHAELPVRGRESVSVHVREDHELVVPCEDPKSIRAVGEGGPQGHRCAEGFVEGFAGRDAEVLRDVPVHSRKQLRIAQVGCLALVPSLELSEGEQGGVPGDVGAADLHEQGLQRVPDSALPVDERAVAVEGEDAVVGQIGHALRDPVYRDASGEVHWSAATLSPRPDWRARFERIGETGARPIPARGLESGGVLTSGC